MRDRPVIGFAGHIDLARVGPVEGLRAALHTVFAAVARAAPAPPRLLTGVAAGADALAIEVWTAAVGTSVDALLPFAGTAPGHTSIRVEAGHVGVAESIAMGCDLLVAIWDGGPGRGPGGTHGVIERARALGRPCIVIGQAGLADTPDWQRRLAEALGTRWIRMVTTR